MRYTRPTMALARFGRLGELHVDEGLLGIAVCLHTAYTEGLLGDDIL